MINRQHPLSVVAQCKLLGGHVSTGFPRRRRLKNSI